MHNPFTAAIEAIRVVDVHVFAFLNRFAGNWFVDHLASFEEGNNLLKGGILLCFYASSWFGAEQTREDNRRTIVTIFTGTFIALLFSRVIADLAPFRVRPMFQPGLLQHPFAFPVSHNMESWSSFPSDTAAYFSALVFGLWKLTRRYSVLLALYTAVWICLPRMFLGEHYLSDIVVGAAIGIASVAASLKFDLVRSKFASQVLALSNSKPGLFYAATFLICFEMAVLFDDLRLAARAIFLVASRHQHSNGLLMLSVLLLGAVIVVGTVVRTSLHHAT